MVTIIITVENDKQADEILGVLKDAEEDLILDFGFGVSTVGRDETKPLKLSGGPNWEMRPSAREARLEKEEDEDV